MLLPHRGLAEGVSTMSELQLPIDVVPGSVPPKFNWRKKVDHLGTTSVIECSGSLSPSVEGAVVELIATAREALTVNERLARDVVKLVDERNKLQAFKDWVHAYLDAQGVPREFPDGKHTKEGCRIGDRMDWLMEQLNTANRRANAAQTLNSNQRQMLDQQKQQSPAKRK